MKTVNLNVTDQQYKMLEKAKEVTGQSTIKAAIVSLCLLCEILLKTENLINGK